MRSGAWTDIYSTTPTFGSDGAFLYVPDPHMYTDHSCSDGMLENYLIWTRLGCLRRKQIFNFKFCNCLVGVLAAVC